MEDKCNQKDGVFKNVKAARVISIRSLQSRQGEKNIALRLFLDLDLGIDQLREGNCNLASKTRVSSVRISVLVRGC